MHRKRVIGSLAEDWNLGPAYFQTCSAYAEAAPILLTNGSQAMVINAQLSFMMSSLCRLWSEAVGGSGRHRAGR
ncbi:hypothetical protein LSTR_LSTR002585 [Laodelphax striatellus]|uniref:Uncharacterized protein n=1 Tax=Laodelphax striatellus TaxID=195883 RepID=A0A482XLL3_LAOST|nr:hypothetical protein LSTR_LSTR002585 [Laodelphax striatellus]